MPSSCPEWLARERYPDVIVGQCVDFPLDFSYNTYAIGREDGILLEPAS